MIVAETSVILKAEYGIEASAAVAPARLASSSLSTISAPSRRASNPVRSPIATMAAA